MPAMAQRTTGSWDDGPAIGRTFVDFARMRPTAPCSRSAAARARLPRGGRDGTAHDRRRRPFVALPPPGAPQRPERTYAVADASCLALPRCGVRSQRRATRVEFVADRARRRRRDAARDTAGRHGRSIGLGFPRRPGLSATCSGTPPPASMKAAGAARDRLFATPLATADGLAALWAGAGLTEIETAVAHHSHGLPVVRRLLATAARRPGAGRYLRGDA